MDMNISIDHPPTTPQETRHLLSETRALVVFICEQIRFPMNPPDYQRLEPAVDRLWRIVRGLRPNGPGVDTLLFGLTGVLGLPGVGCRADRPWSGERPRVDPETCAMLRTTARQLCESYLEMLEYAARPLAPRKDLA